MDQVPRIGLDMDRRMPLKRSVLVAALALFSTAANATDGIGGGYDAELPPESPIEPFMYVDGVNGVANIAAGQGVAAYFDAANGVVTVETPGGVWDLTLGEVINAQTVSSPGHALAEIMSSGSKVCRSAL